MNPDDTFGDDVASDEPVTDPAGLLRRWLARCDGSVTPLMTLSTLGTDGYPDSRHVLLSRCDAAGRIGFHTDSRSRKLAELSAQPRACVAVVWPGVARQLVVTGDVTVQDAAGQAEAYTLRSRYLQLLAWVNDDDAAQLPVEERRAAWAAYDASHPQLHPPRTWVGYTLTPRRIAFWRGDADGPSQRLLCTRDARAADGWVVERRAG